MFAQKASSTSLQVKGGSPLLSHREWSMARLAHNYLTGRSEYILTSYFGQYTLTTIIT